MRLRFGGACCALAGAWAMLVTTAGAVPARAMTRSCAATCSCLSLPMHALAYHWRRKNTSMVDTSGFWIRGTAVAERRVSDTSKAPAGAPLGWQAERERIVTEFRVEESWRRPAATGVRERAVLSTPAYSLCPEPSWKPGHTYLVYIAFLGDTLVSGGPCWETHEVTDSVARRALKELGRGDWRRRSPK